MNRWRETGPARSLLPAPLTHPVFMINCWPPCLRTTLASFGNLSCPSGDPHDRITVGALSSGGLAFAQTAKGFSLVL